MPDHSADLLDVNEAAALLRLSASNLNKRRVEGNGPAFLKLGRAVRYQRSALLAWAESQTVQSTTEYRRAS